MTIEPDGTMVVALRGELTVHPWRDVAAAPSPAEPDAEPDAFSLFVARSSAMGWLADPAGGIAGGVWGMNDANLDPASGPARLAWFQVSLSRPVPPGRPLPIQAFLSCAGDVAARFGSLRLWAVQAELPLQSLDGTPSARMSAVGALMQDAGWFAGGDPRARTPVRVTLDGKRDPAIRAAAAGMLDWLRTLRQDVFVCESVSTEDPPLHRADFDGVLAEWSLDAVGWLAALLAEAGSQCGIGSPLSCSVMPTAL